MTAPTPRPQHILTVNAGSSSLRLGLFRIDASGTPPLALARQHYVGPEPDAHASLAAWVAERASDGVDVVAHRVVHGGTRRVAACLIDAAVEADIEALAPLAPLHNPLALRWIRASRDLLGAVVPQVAVFDTAFFAALPEVARHYAIPRHLADRHGLRRYGFHGLAHQGMAQRWRALHPNAPPAARLITLQLGSGCSMAAIAGDRPRDTSMGYSPLEGLVMATRSGDVDAGLLLHLQDAEAWSAADTGRMLNRQSGLLGVSGISSDMRVLLATDTPPARLAVELYCYRARKQLGAYLAVLGGADAIIFGGGVGEHAAPVRAAILADLGWAGIHLDQDRNRQASGTEARLSTDDSPTAIWVLPVDESTLLAQQADALLDAAYGRQGASS